MTDYEPYVSDPAEPAPLPRFARLRSLATVGTVTVAAVALGALLLLGGGTEDPSLDVPIDQFAPDTPTQTP